MRSESNDLQKYREEDDEEHTLFDGMLLEDNTINIKVVQLKKHDNVRT